MPSGTATGPAGRVAWYTKYPATATIASATTVTAAITTVRTVRWRASSARRCLRSASLCASRRSCADWDGPDAAMGSPRPCGLRWVTGRGGFNGTHLEVRGVIEQAGRAECSAAPGGHVVEPRAVREGEAVDQPLTGQRRVQHGAEQQEQQHQHDPAPEPVGRGGVQHP